MNTLSEIEEYYKTREQQLLKKIHQQEAALTAAEQTLKQLIKSQKAQLDETNQLHATQERAFKEELYRDSLTGAYNRRYYEEVVRKSIGPAGIALLDVDDFKICNDAYGHYAGDMALKTATKAIQSCIRESDLLIRYGGDEFLLVLPSIPGDFLQTKLEQIHTAAQMASVPGYSHFRISLSIGGTIQTIADPMENIVRRADWLMYQAKCRKNAVMVEIPGRSLAAPETLLQEKSQVLLVDDSKMNRMMLAEILGDSYHVLEAENGKECIEKLQEEAGNIALVLLDINMPVMDGFEVLKAMNANHTIEDTPVIMISSEDSDAAIRRSYELGASDYVNRPFDARIVYRRVTNTIKLYAKQRRLVQMVSDQIRARENNTDMLVGVLSHIVEFRNGESGLHVRHIRIITETLLHCLLEVSDKYSISAEQQDLIPLASALHDIGKIGIDDKILNKPGKLTPEEFEVIKTHSILGAEMLQNLDNFGKQPLLQTAYEIARWHHERWDGRGYPDGLKGDEIPISAQLVSLADVYDVSVKDLAELTSEGETSSGTLSDGTWGGTVLRTGSTGSAVEQLQFWLNTLAQYDSAIHSVTVDGVFGSGTAAAVRAFQRKYGLTVDGVVGRTTWTEVYDQFRSIQSDNGTPNAYPGTALREGSSGQNVRLVQFWLKIARTVYTSLANVTVDGKFGAGTAAAVQRFQRYFGLTADGVVGRTTWQKLYEVYNDIANRLLSPSLRPGEYPGVLRTGSSGTAVRELQFYLYLMSAYESSIPPVSIDGKFGADTERAVRAYQRFAGLTVDGVVGRTTWNSLYGRASQLRSSGPVVTLKRLPYPGTPLTVGSSGSAVLYYTLLLQRIAYYFSSVEAPPLSDQYTDETAAATRSAQQLLGLEQTGIADADTWTAVEALSLQLAAHAPNPDRDTPPSTAYPGRAIAEGSAGQEVGQVERWLNRRAQLSCGEDYVADNNRFGAADAAAVRAVQQQAGLLVTGIVNRDTWAALQAQSCNCDKEE